MSFYIFSNLKLVLKVCVKTFQRVGVFIFIAVFNYTRMKHSKFLTQNSELFYDS